MNPNPFLRSEHDTERRGSPRVSVFWPARVVDETGAQEAVCFNVSYGGLALYLWSPPRTEEVVNVSLELPNGETAAAFGKLVSAARGSGRTVGLSLVSHPDQALEALNAYIDRRFEPLASTAAAPSRED